MSEALLDAFPALYYGEAPTRGTVRGGHTMTRAIAANIVALGRPARRIGPIQAQTVNGATWTAGYVRSHDSIKQLALAWHYRPAGLDTLATVAVELTITDAAGHTVSSSSDLIPLGFKGVGTVPAVASRLYQSESLLGGSGHLDLDALAAVLTNPSWSFSFTFTASDNFTALDRIEGWECPRAQVDAADTYGVPTGPFNPGNPILAGTADASGYERLARTIEGGIACGRTLLSVSWPLDTAVAPGLIATGYTPFTRMLEAGTTPWTWNVRPRVLYAPSSATGERHRVRYLYQVTGGGSGAIRLGIVGSGTPVDITGLTASTWTWSSWADCYIPTNGTNRVAKLRFTGKTTAGALYVAGIQVEEYPS